MGGGLFDVFVFETHAANSAYASILASYTLGAKLYASPFGLLTNEVPSGLSAPYTSGVDTVAGYVTRVPTASDLELGIKLAL